MEGLWGVWRLVEGMDPENSYTIRMFPSATRVHTFHTFHTFHSLFSKERKKERNNKERVA
jgi:hypothetical protein